MTRPYTLWREALVLGTYTLLCVGVGVLGGWHLAQWAHRGAIQYWVEVVPTCGAAPQVQEDRR